MGRGGSSLSLCAALIVLGAPAVALAAPRTWRPPVALDHHGATLEGVACPAATQCTAVDSRGREITFSPADPARSAHAAAVDTRGSGDLQAIACPTVTQCTAVDESGMEVTFDPRTGTSHQASLGIRAVGAGAAPLETVACPSVSECVTITTAGEAVTFDPLLPAQSHRTKVLPAMTLSPELSCPSASECAAVGPNAGVSVFDPLLPAQTPRRALTGHQIGPLACPLLSECDFLTGGTARGASGGPAAGAGRVGILDPVTRHVSHLVRTADAPYWAAALSCPTPTDCVDLAVGGAVREGDPLALVRWTAGAGDPGARSDFPQNTLACPSVTVCVIVDQRGRVAVGSA